jgi:hypothetical protein
VKNTSNPQTFRDLNEHRRIFDIENLLCGHLRDVQRVFTYKNERVKGIEPSCPAWEASVLPLNYTRVFGSKWSMENRE